MDVEIQRWRNEIDVIDRKLLDLFNTRARVAQQIAARKQAVGLPIYDRAREVEVLSRARRGNPGPLTGSAIERLFTRIIHESRSLEGEMLARWSGSAAGGTR